MYFRVRWYHVLTLLLLFIIALESAQHFSELAIRVDLTIPDRSFPDSGEIKGLVCNRFGDPLPGVSVTLAGKHTVTGEDGEFYFAQIPLGNRPILLEYQGYKSLSRLVKIDAGTNYLEFKYEQGLFPANFALDFHIYFTEISLELGHCFGEIGIANGANSSYYLLDLVIYNPLGVETLSLLQTEDDYREITGTLSDINFVAKPRMAVFYRPGEYYKINLPPLANPIVGGFYILKAVYASQTQWDAGLATMEVLETECVFDDDWNPHT